MGRVASTLPPPLVRPRVKTGSLINPPRHINPWDPFNFRLSLPSPVDAYLVVFETPHSSYISSGSWSRKSWHCRVYSLKSSLWRQEALTVQTYQLVWLRPREGGEHSLMWSRGACAAKQGIVFRVLSLKHATHATACLTVSGLYMWCQRFFPPKVLAPWFKFEKNYSILYAKRNESGSCKEKDLLP